MPCETAYFLSKLLKRWFELLNIVHEFLSVTLKVTHKKSRPIGQLTQNITGLVRVL